MEVMKRLFQFVQCLVCQTVKYKRVSVDTFVTK